MIVFSISEVSVTGSNERVVSMRNRPRPTLRFVSMTNHVGGYSSPIEFAAITHSARETSFDPLEIARRASRKAVLFAVRMGSF